jgi:hypothetical protein
VTEARVEETDFDPWAAKLFLSQAQALLADGSRNEISGEGRQLLLHSAAMAACDAILAIHGKRVVGTEQGHQRRLEGTQGLLSNDYHQLFDHLDEGRVARNAVSYRAGFVPPPDVKAAFTAVTELVEIAEAHIEARLPDWAKGDRT